MNYSSDGFDVDDLADDNANVILESSDTNSSNSYDSLDSSLVTTKIGNTTNESSQHVNFNSMISIDSGEDDEEVLENERNWAELPSFAIEKIYSFLSRTDQSRMSLVCSRWAKEFDSPSLWKTMKFYLTERDYSSEICPEVKFARKYASMFQHVEIIYKRRMYGFTQLVWRQLKLFLQAMAPSSQLTSIKFINMGKYFRLLNDRLYEGLFKTIIDFFNSQENLRTVVFQESHFSKEECSELLKAIFHSDSNTIRNLILLGFENEAPITVLRCQYISNLSEVCCRIANVQSLEIDYTQLFIDVINCLYEKLSSGEYQLDKTKSSMSTLYIYREESGELGTRRFLPEAWKYLAKVFPGMIVKMKVTMYSHLNSEMEKFLVREIPLQTLDFQFTPSSTSSWINISALFTHLQFCNYHNHLEVLNIYWMSSIADFARSAIPFILSCKKLQSFNFHSKYTPSDIEKTLKTILENHPTSLKSMQFKYFQEEENEDNLALVEEYCLLFKAQRIEFSLLRDLLLFANPGMADYTPRIYY